MSIAARSAPPDPRSDSRGKQERRIADPEPYNLRRSEFMPVRGEHHREIPLPVSLPVLRLAQEGADFTLREVVAQATRQRTGGALFFNPADGHAEFERACCPLFVVSRIPIP
jgi:hypothetical protein